MALNNFSSTVHTLMRNALCASKPIECLFGESVCVVDHEHRCSFGRCMIVILLARGIALCPLENHLNPAYVSVILFQDFIIPETISDRCVRKIVNALG